MGKMGVDMGRRMDRRRVRFFFLGRRGGGVSGVSRGDGQGAGRVCLKGKDADCEWKVLAVNDSPPPPVIDPV
jgi:hypothetical protein